MSMRSMKTVWAAGAGILVMGTLAFLSIGAQAEEAPKGSPDRVAAIRHIMAGIHGPHCGAIGQLLKGEGPKDDKAWGEVLMHAALLNESGHLLMQNGRCPDGVWADATAALRKGTSGLFAAAGKKDLAAAQDSFKEVTTSCQSCHAKHKNAPAATVAAAPAPAPAPAPAAAPAAKPAPQPAPTAAAAAPAPAEVAVRVATIRHLMSGLNQPNCAGLGEALKGEGPKDEKAWSDVVRFAALLNEVGFLLLDNKRCPDEVWKNAAVNLRENAAKVVHAGTIKNLDDARTGFKGVASACGACHQVHKKPAS